ncbi:MAG TPA: hypothetical protein VL866_11190 [Pyrinomonadaceae bacterium]|nr:hypothetical protein [Pyrinomonadaceae bacterium]
MGHIFKRVAIVGTSCSGKTTFAKELARKLNKKHVELDAINWLPGWTPRPDADFKELVEKAISEDEWIIDGNYSRVRDLVWERATTLIWLNYSFPIVMYRALSRTLKRAVNRQVLYSGNRESLRMAFLTKDSILLWVLKTYHRRRREYTRMLLTDPRSTLNVVVLGSPGEAKRFLSQLRQ